MSEGLEYLDSIVWRKFPRNADQTLRVSDATKEKVLAYLDAQEGNPMQEAVIQLIESRCNYAEFTATSAIVYGLDLSMRQRVYCCLRRMVRLKKIESRGKAGRYAYRLLAKPVEVQSHKSALQSMRAAEVARRYA